MEQWEQIKDFPEYAISNYGRIKRLKDRWNSKAGRILTPSPDRKIGGYALVTLIKNGKRFNKRIHQLVAEAFMDQCPRGKCVNHIDANSMNNHIENLEYATQSKNIKHGIALGNVVPPKGEKNGQSKLKHDEVWLIRKLLQSKIKGYLIAKIFKVSQSTISMIKHNYRWGGII